MKVGKCGSHCRSCLAWCREEFSGMGGLTFGGEIIGGILEVGSYFCGRILGH